MSFRGGEAELRTSRSQVWCCASSRN